MSQYRVGDLIRHSEGRAFRLKKDPLTGEVERPEVRIALNLAREVYGSAGYVSTISGDGSIEENDQHGDITKYRAVIAQRKAGDGPRDGISTTFAIYHPKKVEAAFGMMVAKAKALAPDYTGKERGLKTRFRNEYRFAHDKDGFVARFARREVGLGWLDPYFQPSDISFKTDDGLLACPGCADAFANGDPDYDQAPLLTNPYPAKNEDVCDICNDCDCVTIYISELGGWLSLDGDGSPLESEWMAHRDSMPQFLIDLLLDREVVGDDEE